MTPGDNLLLEALDMIESQAVQYYRYLSRSTTGAGVYLSTFDAAVPVTVGSVQAVPMDKYQVLGLEMSKKYVTWFVPRNVIGLERDAAGDQFTYGTERFQIENTTDWFTQDGWVSCLSVKIS